MKQLHVSGPAYPMKSTHPHRLQEFIPTNTSFNRQFLDLLQKIFVYDPKNRITAKQALKHPWFKETIIDDGTEASRIGQQLQRGAQRS
jgi:dual-specificity kinase